MIQHTGYVVKDTADRTEDPDISIFDDTCKQGRAAWQIDDTTRNQAGVTVDRRPYLARAAFAWCVSVIEVKHTSEWDPFGKETGCDTEAAGKSRMSRAQIIRYAGETLLRQHRECVYTAFIVAGNAYLMRWDRNGCVVSERFNYLADPAPLLNFVYAIATASRAGQGYDTSVTLASDAQLAALNAYYAMQEAGGYQRRFLDEMKGAPELHPIHQVRETVLCGCATLMSRL